MSGDEFADDVPDEERWKSIRWDIRREGRAWSHDEFMKRIDMGPEKMEIIDGKIFWNEDERMTMLGMVLEGLGIDKAVRIGDPELWRQALDRLGEDEGG